MSLAKKKWEDYCDTESESETKTEKSEEKQETPLVPTKEEPQIDKKFPFNNQPKEEMLKEIEKTDTGHYFINIFNIENSATKEDILNFYQNIKIKEINANEKKQGNYDLELDSKEEVFKLIAKGTGRINKRQFYMRISYKNNRKQNGNFEKKEFKTSHSKKPAHEPEDENMEYYFYSQNNNKDKKLKPTKLKMNRTFSNKAFDSNSKPSKERTPQLRKIISGPKKNYSVEYVKKENQDPSGKLITNHGKLDQILENEFSHKSPTENLNSNHDILSKDIDKNDQHEENYLTDIGHYHSFVNTSQEIEPDHSKKEIFGTPRNDMSALSKHGDEISSGNKHLSIEEQMGTDKYLDILKNVINEKNEKSPDNGETDSNDKKEESCSEKAINEETNEEEEKQNNKNKKKNKKKKKGKKKVGEQNSNEKKKTSNIYDLLGN